MRYLILLLMLCSACASQYPPTGGGMVAANSDSTPDIFATQAVVNAMAQHYAGATSTAQVATQHADETQQAYAAATKAQESVERSLSISETQVAIDLMGAQIEYSSTVAAIRAQLATYEHDASLQTQAALDRPAHQTATAVWQENETAKGNWTFGALLLAAVVVIIMLGYGLYLFFSAKADEISTRNYTERIAALNASVSVKQVNNLVLVFVAGELVEEREINNGSTPGQQVIDHTPRQLPPSIPEDKHSAATLLLDTMTMQQRGGIAPNQLCSSYAFEQAGNKRWSSGGNWKKALDEMRGEFKTSENGTFLVGRWHNIAQLYAAMCRGYKPSPAPVGVSEDEQSAD